MKRPGVTASLLDRIFWDDDDPRIMPGRITEAAYIASAVRDLQDLLNARNVLRNVTPTTTRTQGGERQLRATLVDSSVIMAGVPDFSSLSLARYEDRVRLTHEIAYTIETFDRRFTDVRVELMDTSCEGGRLPFVIRARLTITEFFASIDLEAQYESSGKLFTVSLQDSR
jgi:type VI secretion system protein ImpF